jgi:hypothetical protein
MSAERLLSTLICGGRTCRGLEVRLRYPTYRSTTWIASRRSGAERTKLYRVTRSHLFGRDSSAVAANVALGVGVALPRHPRQHRPERPILLEQFDAGSGTERVEALADSAV